MDFFGKMLAWAIHQAAGTKRGDNVLVKNGPVINAVRQIAQPFVDQAVARQAPLVASKVMGAIDRINAPQSEKDIAKGIASQALAQFTPSITPIITFNSNGGN